MQIMINGTLKKEHQAKISVLDHGFTVGDGIFETLRADTHGIYKYDKHFARLQHSARALKIKLPITKQQLKRQLHATLKANKLTTARIRITITRGIGAPGLSTDCADPNVIITVSELKKMPKTGIKVITITLERPFPHIKSLSYLPNVIARQKAKEHGAVEAILINKKQHATEGSFSNLFIVKSRTLITPKGHILKGITRDEVITLARTNRINVNQGIITKKQLQHADECFITFTTQGIIPVTQIDSKKLPVGKLTKQLIKLYGNYK